MSLRSVVSPGISVREDFPLRCRDAALLIVDVQKYLTYPEQVYFHQEAFPRAVKNIGRLAKEFRRIRDSSASGCEVIFTFLQSATNDRRDISLDYKLSGPTLANIPRACDTDIFCDDCQPDMASGKGDILVPKTSCSVFQSTNLHYLLSNLGIQQLVITGQLTDQCVQSAVRDAADLGYMVTLVDDSCAAYTVKHHEDGLRGMEGFCRIVDTDKALRELNDDNSTAPNLKDVSLVDVSKFLKENGFIDAAFAVVGKFSSHEFGALKGGTKEFHDETASRPNIAHTPTESSSLQNDEDIVTVSGSVMSEMESTHVSHSKLQHETIMAVSKAMPKFKPGRDPSVVAASAMLVTASSTPRNSIVNTLLDVPTTLSENVEVVGGSSGASDKTTEVIMGDHRSEFGGPSSAIMDSNEGVHIGSDATGLPRMESSGLHEDMSTNKLDNATVAKQVLAANFKRDPSMIKTTQVAQDDSSREVVSSPRILAAREESLSHDKKPQRSPGKSPVHGEDDRKQPALARYKKGRDPSVLNVALPERIDRPELSHHHMRPPQPQHEPVLKSGSDHSNAAHGLSMRHFKPEGDVGKGATTAAVVNSSSSKAESALPTQRNTQADTASNTTHDSNSTLKSPPLSPYKSSRDPSVWVDEKSFDTVKAGNRSPGNGGVGTMERKQAPPSSSLSNAQYAQLRSGSTTLRDGVARYPESILKAVAVETVPADERSPQVKSDAGNDGKPGQSQQRSDPPAKKQDSYSFVEL